MTKSFINDNGIGHQTQEALRHQIRPIVEHFLKTDEGFEGLECDRALNEVSDVFFRNGNDQELQQMTDEIMTQKVRRILGTNMLFRLLSDLTPEEIQEFDAALLDLRKGRY